MKLLLDQHFSRKLVPLLEPAFSGTLHVLLRGLDRASDETIWEFTKSGGFAIATKDEDFQVLSFAKGTRPRRSG